MIVYAGSAAPFPDLIDLCTTMVLRSFARTAEDARDRRVHASSHIPGTCRTIIRIQLERAP